MTSSIPDGLSMDDLHSLLEIATQEDEIKATKPEGCDSEDQFSENHINHVADEALHWATERSEGPVVHKVMAMKVIIKMIEWHTTMAEMALDNGNTESAICWARDAGKFQAMMDSMLEISVGNEDFAVNDHLQK